MSNGLDPDQDRCFPDLCPNCLQRLTSKKIINRIKHSLSFNMKFLKRAKTRFINFVLTDHSCNTSIIFFKFIPRNVSVFRTYPIVIITVPILKFRTFSFLNSIKMLVFRAEINKMLVRIAYREDPDQTASDLGLRFLSGQFLTEN